MFDELAASLNLIEVQTQNNYKTLAIICAILAGIYLVNLLLGRRLLLLGIFPRHLFGLPGILFAPLLHADFDHLFFNLIPLVVLSNFILFNGLAFYLKVSLFIGVLSGFLTWLMGKRGLHVGASGLISGYWSFLVWNIFQQGTLMAIIIGIVTLYYFAGIFLGIFPSVRKDVSWEGHFFGFCAGICASYIFIT